MATVTAYWHKGGGWWTVRVNDQRATVRGKAAAAAAAEVMRQAEQTETDTETSYVIRSGDPLDAGGEYWQDCDLSRVSWGPRATAYVFTAAHRADMERLAERLGGEWVTA